MQSNLIGKRAVVTDDQSIFFNEWGTITDFDGEYYYIAIADGLNCQPMFARNEFRIMLPKYPKIRKASRK